ncbi:hypothetical protein I3760_15G107900 [Carya illinoinensis]|nr:hypothetical protein I3760_15G107900 [Carya illinoinensis]
MAFRLSHVLISLLLWLSLLLLFFSHGRLFSFYSTKNIRSIQSHHMSISQHTLISNRKVLAGKINFKAYRRHRHHRHHPSSRGHVPVQPGPAAGSEIDPRYGAEKRLVPTGPNPLHH